jgi:hypothetical protein
MVLYERPRDYFDNGQILESRRVMGIGKNARERRIVYQYSFKRAKRDNRTSNLMIDKAERIADGKAPLKKARFLKVTGAQKALDQATIDRARQLASLKGYVTNLPETKMPGTAVISAYHDLWQVEASFRMTKSDCAPGPCSTVSARPSKPTSPPCSQPSPSNAICRRPPGHPSSASSGPYAQSDQRPSNSTDNPSRLTPTYRRKPKTSSRNSAVKVTKPVGTSQAGGVASPQPPSPPVPPSPTAQRHYRPTWRSAQSLCRNKWLWLINTLVGKQYVEVTAPNDGAQRT